MSDLFHHHPHPHTPANVNAIHKAEQIGPNARIAVALTRGVGSMWCAYLFALLACIGLFGLLGWLDPFTFLLATWASQQFAQLVLLPIIMVGQNVLNRKQELQAEELYQTAIKDDHEISQMKEHLDAQDRVLLDIQKSMKGEGHGG